MNRWWELAACRGRDQGLWFPLDDRRDGGPHRSLAGCRSIERRWSARWRWAERAGEWDCELWRRADKATLAAAGGARPA